LIKKLFLVLLLLVLLSIALLILLSHRSYNVVFITIDTLRADYLSCYNPKALATPNMDRIAQEGVLFSNAYATIPITLPSHTVMFTSREPYELKLFNNTDVFDHKVPMVTDILEYDGYHTAAFISLGVLRGTNGLGSGFNVYEDDFEKFHGRFYKFASEVNEVAISWLENNRRKRFFAWIHYSDPHEPYVTINAPTDTEVEVGNSLYGKYCFGKREEVILNLSAQPGENRIAFHALGKEGTARIDGEDSYRYVDTNVFITPPEGIQVGFGPEWQDMRLENVGRVHGFKGNAVMTVLNQNLDPVKVQIRFMTGVFGQELDVIQHNYEMEVQYVDRYIGELWKKLKTLGINKKTIVILTADHGEGLKTHGVLGHVSTLYNEVARIPLIIYYPRLGYSHKVVSDMVNHLDLMPTVLDLLHKGNTKVMRGHSLKKYLSWSPIDRISSDKTVRTTAFLSTFAPEARLNGFSIIQDDLKLIQTPKRARRQLEIFNLHKDPLERRNLSRYEATLIQSPQVNAMRGRLEEYRKAAEKEHGHRKNQEPNAEEKEMLESLGYVQGDQN
jgi:arylsulfatase A-like enzyme